MLSYCNLSVILCLILYPTRAAIIIPTQSIIVKTEISSDDIPSSLEVSNNETEKSFGALVSLKVL